MGVGREAVSKHPKRNSPKRSSLQAVNKTPKYQTPEKLVLETHVKDV